MRVLVQRCINASVKINEKVNGYCQKWFVLFVGFTNTDTKKEIEYLAKKIANLRIFPDEKGLMNKSLLEVNGSILSISQFTLYADPYNGNRPSYKAALEANKAKEMYDLFNQEIQKYVPVETGIFGENMEVTFTNVGPTTIWLER